MPARSQPPRAAALRGEAARTGRTPADRPESLSPDHGATQPLFAALRRSRFFPEIARKSRGLPLVLTVVYGNFRLYATLRVCKT